MQEAHHLNQCCLDESLALRHVILRARDPEFQRHFLTSTHITPSVAPILLRHSLFLDTPVHLNLLLIMRRTANPSADRAAQNTQTLKTLVKIESNKTCADCKRNKRAYSFPRALQGVTPDNLPQIRDGLPGTSASSFASGTALRPVCKLERMTDRLSAAQASTAEWEHTLAVSNP